MGRDERGEVVFWFGGISSFIFDIILGYRWGLGRMRKSEGVFWGFVGVREGLCWREGK